MNLEEFLKAYIVCALWSSTDPYTEDQESLDLDYDIEDIHPDTLEVMRQDCREFLAVYENDIASLLDEEVPSSLDGSNRWGMAGHDFWLNRNHHGSGFWDGDWPEELGLRMSNYSHGVGSFNLRVSEDGKVCHE